MSDFYTEKLRQYADLVVPFTGCPFGEPINECPFIEFHQIGNESKQIEKVDLHTEKELSLLRSYHRDCMQKYFNGDWEPKVPRKVII
jgi:hypothetical protein